MSTVYYVLTKTPTNGLLGGGRDENIVGFLGAHRGWGRMFNVHIGMVFFFFYSMRGQNLYLCVLTCQYMIPSPRHLHMQVFGAFGRFLLLVSHPTAAAFGVS